MSPQLNSILELTSQLVSLKTVPENHSDLQQGLSLITTKLASFTIEKFTHKGVNSILVHNQSQGHKKFKIILNGHLDVIPGKETQYHPEIKGDRLFGTGSMDMKGSVACLVETFLEVANLVNYPLALQIATDEEVGGFNSTKFQVDNGVRSEFVIAGESTSFNIVNKAKGILWIKITTTGKSAHGAYPWKGINAIWKMNNFLTLLEKEFPTPRANNWSTTLNLSRIETTNNTYNKVPDDCQIMLDVRYTPEDQSSVIQRVKRLLPKGFRMEIVVNESPLYVPASNTYMQNLKQVVKKELNFSPKFYGAHGSSDARHFTTVNCNGIEFGPMGGGIGSDSEWVSIKSLESYNTVLKNFLLNITS